VNISGDVRLRLGREFETMSTLARGEFDIRNLPVLEDQLGAFGSTVSDSRRTSVGEHTANALFVIYFVGAVDTSVLGAAIEHALSIAGLPGEGLSVDFGTAGL
jgi:DNA/RNA-binding domain of Phe-tRNA-synthetase-like protein